MELFIYCFITALVASAANADPQTTISSSLTSAPKFGDRLKTPELTLYLTRDVVKALQDVKLPQKTVSSIKSPEQNFHTYQENYNDGGHEIHVQQSQPKKSLKKNRGFVSRFFLPRDKDVIENQQRNDLAKFYLDSLKIQKDINKNFQNLHQNNANNEESQIQTNANFRPYIPVPYPNQEEELLQEQLKQQWNHVLDHNRAELQGISASKHQNEENNQSPPILIHSELRITKHHPVPVYKVADLQVPKHSFGMKLL